MINRNTLLLTTILTGSLLLAGIGISRAQATDEDVSTNTAAEVTAPADRPSMGLRGHHQEMQQEQADLFGITTTELQSEIDAGKPMYQIAAEHGVTYDTIKQRHSEEMQTRLDDMVKVGYMTQEQADSIAADMESQPMLGMGFGHGQGHGRGM